MDIRVLRYFLAVAQAETISAAAEALHVTQPTLSRQLMDLEGELGKKLFIRGSRRIVLTEDGLLLRKRAGEIVALMEKTQAEFHEPEAVIGGDIYMGGGETCAMRLIAQAAREFREKHPLVRYHLFSGNAEDVSERLDKGLLDFGLFIEPANLNKYDFIRLPATDLWGVLLPKNHPLAKHETIQREALWKLPLLISHQSLVQNEIYSLLGKEADALNIVSTYNLIYNAALMVEEGLGFAITLDHLVNTTGDSALCFRPLEPRQEAALDLVWKKHSVFSKATAKFLEYLMETIE